MNNEQKKPEAYDLIGKTIISIISENDTLRIATFDGGQYVFMHYQDYCEQVYIVQVDGNLSDLIGSPLTGCVHEASDEKPSAIKNDETWKEESVTWTTIVFETASARASVYWLGQSNGYYGEDIELKQIF
jgi:hypothetical protein